MYLFKVLGRFITIPNYNRKCEVILIFKQFCVTYFISKYYEKTLDYILYIILRLNLSVLILFSLENV